MMRQTTYASLLRAAAAIVAGVAVIAFAAVILTGGEIALAALAQQVLLLIAALGISAALVAIAGAVGRDPNSLPPEAHRALMRFQTQITELAGKVNEVGQACERIAASQPAYAPDTSAMTLTPSDLEPLYQAIRELRELTLLTDAERRERLDRLRQERRASLIKQSFDLVAARQWHQAERLVLAMETEFPNDDEVTKARDYLNHARRLNEEETVSRTIREVEELMALSSWDAAFAKARTLVDGFPDNPQARTLLMRVQRERDVFHESTVHRMFDELRHDIDRRMWRRALDHAQHLLEKYPTDPRADGVRRQLKTLQDNAEIEERQELEIRIQELIRAQQFDEAIALGEDVIRRYPMSPQADSLDTLLPRLRELAQGQQPPTIHDFAGLVHEYDEEEPEHRLA